MATDTGVVIALLALALALPGSFFLIRITYYDDKIPDLLEATKKWLSEIEVELNGELNSVTGAHSIEKVVSIASKFSAAKLISDKLEELESSNSSFIKLDIVAVGTIVATGATYFASGLQEFVSYGLGGLLSLLGIIAGLLWFGSFVSFYTTSTSFSDLKRRIRKKDHSSGSS